MFTIVCLTALAALAFLGLVHHLGILALRWVVPTIHVAPHTAPLVAFQGALVLHVVEILLFALLLREVAGWEGVGTLSGDWGGTLTDYIVLSATTFTTLGMTAIKVDGALRLLVVGEALGGFMALTWTATFLFQIWSRHWDAPDRSGA
ncbi:hypothetical protein [Roseivivax sp. CAU 1761]